MAAVRFSRLRSLCYSAKFVDSFDVRRTSAFGTGNYYSRYCRESGFKLNPICSGLGITGLDSAVGNGYSRGKYTSPSWSSFSNLAIRSGAPFGGVGPMLNYRSYSSSTNSQDGSPQVPAAASGDGGSSASDWAEKVKEIWNSTVDAVTYTGEKAREASSEVTPHVQQLLDTHPYLRDVVVPVGGTLMGTLLAWMVLPSVLRRFHKYSTQGPAALLSGSSLWGPVPYENSIWGALEKPVRYLVTFMAVSQIAIMVAPTTIAAQYIAPAWRGAIILSFIWFLNRWKTNVITRALATKSGVDRDNLLTLDKISSVGLFVLGLMGLSEACGVAVQSILTVGGIGGVATAFAGRDILGNVLSGLSVQISRPFSIGDTIKAGSVEGQVIDMGLTTTSLLTSEKFPVIVPNSLFSSQVIVNKSRAQWQAVTTKIPVQIGDFDVIPKISEDIKIMLRSNSNVFLEKEAPYCFLSRVERSFAELTIGCNLKAMGKERFFAAQQEVLLQSVKIIKQHGASLGNYAEDTSY
ncbi:mechanosensitive ion channel protein 1, mitochondrial-like [Coffea arabica]|uniref:Mechanosensitive ion channel protein 1, mitochondrial-like n=1 Tax=Coffea arabica TaxID=13443 RepID=A0A6P6W0G9_COFAR